MEIIDISIVGIISFLLLLINLARSGLKEFILNPINYILLIHIYFLGLIPSYLDNKLHIELMILIGFVLYMGTMFFIYKKFSFRGISTQASSLFYVPQRFFSERNLIIIIFVWVLFTTVYNAHIYGGLDRALVRFYALKPVNEGNGWLTFLDRTGAKLAIACIFSISFQVVKYNRSFVYILISMLLTLIGVIPLGTRGNAILILFAFVLGATLASRNKKVTFNKYWIFIPLVLMSISMIYDFLTNNRTVNFLEGESIVFSAKQQEYTNGNEIKIPIVIKQMDVTINEYGSSRDYLIGHFLYSISANIIPRKYWDEKPIGFGKILAINESNNPNTNVSYAVSYSGEGWANGGWLGVILTSILFGIVTGVFVAKAKEYSEDPKSTVELIKYMLFLSASIIFVRGDMLSAWAAGVYPLILFYMTLLFFNTLIQLFRGGK